MIRSSKALRAALAVLVGLPALLWIAWIVAVPAGMIEERALRAIKDYGGLDASFENFRKGIFLSVKADSITIKFQRGQLRATDLKAAPHLLSLFSLKLEASLDAKLGGGQLKAHYARPLHTYKGESFGLKGRGISLAEFMPLAYDGVSGTGTGRLDIELYDGAGEMRLAVEALEVQPFSVGPYTFPAERLREGRALVTAAPGSLEIVSANIEGEGIFMRLRGRAAGGRFDGAIEIMPSSEIESQPYFMFIQQHKRGTGQYLIPISSALQ